MNINIWMTICLIAAAVSVVAVSVYLILALIQLKKTAKEAEKTFAKINGELDTLNRVSGKVADITGKFSAPVFSAAATVYYLFSAFAGKRKGGNKGGKNV